MWHVLIVDMCHMPHVKCQLATLCDFQWQAPLFWGKMTVLEWTFEPPCSINDDPFWTKNTSNGIENCQGCPGKGTGSNNFLQWQSIPGQSRCCWHNQFMSTGVATHNALFFFVDTAHSISSVWSSKSCANCKICEHRGQGPDLLAGKRCSIIKPQELKWVRLKVGYPQDLKVYHHAIWSLYSIPHTPKWVDANCP